jgi:hypothetical protein
LSHTHTVTVFAGTHVSAETGEGQGTDDGLAGLGSAVTPDVFGIETTKRKEEKNY